MITRARQPYAGSLSVTCRKPALLLEYEKYDKADTHYRDAGIREKVWEIEYVRRSKSAVE